MNKKFITIVFLMLLGMAFSVSEASAKQCSYSGHGTSYQSWDLKGKFSHKAYFMLDNQDELGLSEKQVQSIKDLKISVKKDMIRQEAEIEVIGIDLRSKLHGNPVDVNGTNDLVDKKYELKKTKTKGLVEAFAKLKSTLTQEQYDQLKDLYKQKSE